MYSKLTAENILNAIERPQLCIRWITSAFEMYYLWPVYDKSFISGFRHPKLPVYLLAIHEEYRIKRPQFVTNHSGDEQIRSGDIINGGRLLYRCRAEQVAFFQKP